MRASGPEHGEILELRRQVIDQHPHSKKPVASFRPDQVNGKGFGLEPFEDERERS